MVREIFIKEPMNDIAKAIIDLYLEEHTLEEQIAKLKVKLREVSARKEPFVKQFERNGGNIGYSYKGFTLTLAAFDSGKYFCITPTIEVK